MPVQLKFITQWTSASSPSRWKFKKNYGILKPWTNIWVHTKEIFDILLPLLPWQPTNLRRSHAAAAGLRGQSAPPGWVLRSFWIIFIVLYQKITCNKSLHPPLLCCCLFPLRSHRRSAQQTGGVGSEGQKSTLYTGKYKNLRPLNAANTRGKYQKGFYAFACQWAFRVAHFHSGRFFFENPMMPLAVKPPFPS